MRTRAVLCPAIYALAEAHTVRGMSHDVRSGFLPDVDEIFLRTIVE